MPRHTVVTRRWPERYFTGLKGIFRFMREKELLKRRTTLHPKLKKTDTMVKTKKSKWTQLFHQTYPNLKFNKNLISKRTGIPRSTLDTVYNRGLKAWKTGGSRPGANPHQWAIARVYKYVLVTKHKAKAIGADPDQNLRRRA